MKKGNLFGNIPSDLSAELMEVLAESQGNIRIERIISCGHCSPPGFWYDQKTNEWLVLLKGFAILRIGEKDGTVIKLHPGDWIEIPANTRHRVEETSATEETVWLAIHWS